MKYCSKHISHGNSVKCKNSASRHRRIHWIKRPQVVLKFTTSILGGWPGLSVGLGNGQLSICSISQPPLLAKSGLCASKTLQVCYSFSSLSGDDLYQQMYQQNYVEKTIRDPRYMNIRSRNQIKTERSPYSNHMHGKRIDLSCTLWVLPFPMPQSAENQKIKH